MDVPLEGLEAAGRRELERNLSALRETCRQWAPSLSVEECLARVQAEKPPEGPVEAARRQLAAKTLALDLKQVLEDGRPPGVPPAGA